MSLHFHYAAKMRFAGGRAYNFGGDSSSDSSTNTTTSTSNLAISTDKRAVASDQAVSLTGDGNTLDRSTSNVTQMFDSSNRSTAFNSGNTTNSNNTTIFTDNSDHSVRTSITDYGSVSASMATNSAMTTKALEVADHGIGAAFDSLKLQTTEGSKTIMAAFDLAAKAGANADTSSAKAIGLAQTALQSTQAAMQDAKDGGQQKMVLVALGVIGAIGLAFALKN